MSEQTRSHGSIVREGFGLDFKLQVSQKGREVKSILSGDHFRSKDRRPNGHPYIGDLGEGLAVIVGISGSSLR